MTPLQQAAQALIEQHLPTYLDQHIAELRKALDAELQQTQEPTAYINVTEKSLEWAVPMDWRAVSTIVEYPKMPLYLHPPQPQATTPVVPTLKEALTQQGIKLRTEFEPKQRDSELATESSGELAQSVEPYGWMVSGTPTVMRGSMAQAIQEQEARRIGGICHAFPVYRLPAT